MTDTDDLVAEALGEGIDPDDTDNGDESPTGVDVFVCDWIVDGAPCGRTFDSKRALAGHQTLKHRNAAHTGPKKSAKRKTAKRTAPRTPRAEKPTIVPMRQEMYGTSIVATAVFVHLVAGRYFDAFDLSHTTTKAPAVAEVLEECGEQNKQFQQVADMLLGAAGGAVWLKLFVVMSEWIIPILANHGVIPTGTGDRFVQMHDTFASSVPPTSNGDASVPAPDSPPAGAGTTLPADVSTWSLEDWQSVMFSAARSPAFAEMMQQAGVGDVAAPTVVGVPPSFSQQPEMDTDGDSGTTIAERLYEQRDDEADESVRT